MSPEFVSKYMETARVFGEVKNACKSRKIGALIVNPATNNIIGAGYNSPPRGIPHADSQEYVENYFIPHVKDNREYVEALKNQGLCNERGFSSIDLQDVFCRSCPRRVLGLKSGEGTEICTCAHAEQNAIANKCLPANDCYMFAYCCTPCRDCAKMIINAGIVRVYVAEKEIYHWDTLQMFKDAKVKLYFYDEKYQTVEKANLEKLLDSR